MKIEMMDWMIQEALRLFQNGFQFGLVRAIQKALLPFHVTFASQKGTRSIN
jgi:hypothetical protein